MAKEGLNYDEGKSRVDLIPAAAIEAAGRVFANGAGKYADRNWENGMAWGRQYASLQRHLLAFWRGEDYDAESGEPHLAHALTRLMMLYAMWLNDRGTDDRSWLLQPPAHTTATKGD